MLGHGAAGTARGQLNGLRKKRIMKKTIYIVDDNPDMCEVLVMLIKEEEDLEVCGIAATATEALEALSGLDPDLVITDLGLPGMSGMEFIERLCVLKPTLRAAVMSAHGDSTYAEQSLDAGAKGYILKGDPIVMIEAIRRILGGEIYVSRAMRRSAHRTGSSQAAQLPT